MKIVILNQLSPLPHICFLGHEVAFPSCLFSFIKKSVIHDYSYMNEVKILFEKKNIYLQYSPDIEEDCIFAYIRTYDEVKYGCVVIILHAMFNIHI